MNVTIHETAISRPQVNEMFLLNVITCDNTQEMPNVQINVIDSAGLFFFFLATHVCVYSR